MIPTVLSTGMGYVVTFEEDGEEIVRFEIEDVERVPWGLSATIVVRSRLVGARALRSDFITMERISLLNARNRTDLARTIDGLIPHPASGMAIDWDRVVDETVMSVVEQEKRPLVTLDLSTVPPVAQTFVLPVMLPKGKVTILYGAGGSGKSALAAAISVAVQRGTSFLGWQCEPTNVLYLDWETDPGDLADRVGRASRGMGLRDTAAVRYLNLAGPLAYHQQAVAQAVAENDIGMLVIDSVGMATAGARDGGDLAEGAISFFRGLRQLGTTVLAIDHISSEDLKRKGHTSKPFGSVFKVNAARNTFEVRDTTDIGGPKRLTLVHAKSNTGPLQGDISMHVTWDDDQIRFDRSGFAIAKRDVEERVLEVLATGPASPRGLTDLLNEEKDDPVSEREVREAIHLLRSTKAVTIDPNTGIVRLAIHVVEDEQLTLPDRT